MVGLNWIPHVFNARVLVRAGVSIFLASLTVRGLIIPRLHPTGRARAQWLSAYGLIIGELLLLAALILWWLPLFPWWALAMPPVVLLLALLGWLLQGAGVTLAREPPEVYALRSRFFLRKIRRDLSKAPQGRTRNHIICIDGTWNDPDCKTNVYRLYKALPRHEKTQIKRYYSGVGVRRNKGVVVDFFGEKISKTLIACATGLGATPIHWQAYFDFVKAYQPGDRLFIFGFSRGAAIARMLANDVHTFGIPEGSVASFHLRDFPLCSSTNDEVEERWDDRL